MAEQSKEHAPRTLLTSRFNEALQYAITAQGGQVRKGTAVTYVAHLLGVASLVLDHGGDEDEAIAGLLHDTIEDCGGHHAVAIRARFGDRVADIVLGLTDGTKEDKAKPTTQDAKRADWRRRKEAYLEALQHHGDRVLLVSCCDKLHNARAIVTDLHAIGHGVFDRFTADRDETLWYYEQLATMFTARELAPAAALRRTVDEMTRQAAEQDPPQRAR